MSELEQVSLFIAENVYHSDVYDRATDVQRQKAINSAKRTLQRVLPHFYSEQVPIEAIAEQAIWLMRIDDTMQRAEMGVTSISIDGISLAISEKNRSIAPIVLELNGITETALTKRKTAHYQRAWRGAVRL